MEDPIEMMLDIAVAMNDPKKPEYEKSVVPDDVSFDIYSNNVHAFDVPEADIEKKLRADNELVGAHHAWNFYGKIWFADGLFREEVWQYRTPIEVVTSETLRGVIDAVNSKYGSR